jgi:hypothetical protein
MAGQVVIHHGTHSTELPTIERVKVLETRIVALEKLADAQDDILAVLQAELDALKAANEQPVESGVSEARVKELIAAMQFDCQIGKTGPGVLGHTHSATVMVKL